MSILTLFICLTVSTIITHQHRLYKTNATEHYFSCVQWHLFLMILYIILVVLYQLHLLNLVYFNVFIGNELDSIVV